jgi:hypothetical protein
MASLGRALQEKRLATTVVGLTVSLAVACLAVAAVNIAARAQLDARPANRGYWLIHAKWGLLAEQKQPVDVLVLGDSSCNQGFNNAVFDRITGRTSLNLCTAGHATVLGDLWMLREYLRDVGTPKTVLVVHASTTWSRSLDFAVMAQIPRARLIFEQSELPLTPVELLRYLVARHLPLYAEDQSVRRWLRGKLRKLNFKIDRQGFMPANDRTPKGAHGDALGLLKDVEGLAELSPETQRALAGFDALSESYGFDLVVQHAAMYDALLKQTRFRSEMKQLNGHLTAALKSYRRVWFCPGSMPVTGTELENADHLKVEGSVRYTERLADWYHRSASPQWTRSCPEF